MKKYISRLDMFNVTVFSDQTFDFCSGINIFIGMNGVGKTHLLKLLYATARSCWLHGLESASHDDESLGGNLVRVFNTNNRTAEQMVRRNGREGFPSSFGVAFSNIVSRAGRKRIPLTEKDYCYLSLDLNTGNSSEDTIRFENIEQPIYIPPVELLVMTKGLYPLIKAGKLRLDATIADLSVALDANIVYEPQLVTIAKNIENYIGGRVEEEDGKFIFDDGSSKYEIALIADGFRKLGMLAYLIRNESIKSGSIVFWDEPETNLNPRLIVKTIGIIRELAAAGVQVFVATHDYLVTYELGMAVKYETPPKVPVKFFALYKQGKEKNSPTVHESSNDVSGLQNNAILDEFAAHYDRETALFAKSFRGEK